MMASMWCTLLALLVLRLCTYATFGAARHRNVEEHASTHALPALTPFLQQPVGSALSLILSCLLQSVSDGVCCWGRIDIRGFAASNPLLSCNGTEYKVASVELQVVLICSTRLALRNARLLLTLIA